MIENKYSYDRFGSKGMRVGQAVHDILSKEQPMQTVEETIEAMAPKFTKDLEDTINANKDRYKSPFYVFVLTKKEMWATNVVRNFFIARQTPPDPLNMMCQYANMTKTLYKVDSLKGSLKVKWSLPGLNDCPNILKNPQFHDPDLVAWIDSLFKGTLAPDDELEGSTKNGSFPK